MLLGVCAYDLEKKKKNKMPQLLPLNALCHAVGTIPAEHLKSLPVEG